MTNKQLPPLPEVESAIENKRGWRPFQEIPSSCRKDVHLALYELLIFLAKKDLKSITKVCSIFRKVHSSASFPRSPVAFRLDLLNRLSVSLSLLYSVTKDLTIIDEAIAVISKAIDTAPEGWEDTCNYVYNLSGLYRDIHDNTGSIEALEKADILLKKAIDIAPWGHRNQGLFRYAYLVILQALHTKTGILKYLDDSIQMGEESLSTPLNPRFRGMTLSYLSTIYRRKFLRTKSIDDLDRSIELCRESVGLRDNNTDDEDYAGRLSNLGNVLLEKSRFKGFESCLDEAISLQEKAIQLTSDHHPNLPVRYNNLGNCYEDKYQNSGKQSFLDRAIDCYKKAVSQSSDADPILPSRYYNLANAHRSRYLRSGKKADLTEATRLYEKACTDGLGSYPEWALFSSRTWGQLLFDRADFAGAIHAFNFGLEAINNLYHNQNNLTDKNLWLKDATQLSTRLAYAQVKCGMKMDAIVSLEQGLARNLREKLEQSHQRPGSLRPQNVPLLSTPNRNSIEEALRQVKKYTVLYLLYEGEDLLLLAVNPGINDVSIEVIHPEIERGQLNEVIKNYIYLVRDNEIEPFKDYLDPLMAFLHTTIAEPLRKIDWRDDIILIFTDILDLLPLAAVFPSEKRVATSPSLLSFVQVLNSLDPNSLSPGLHPLSPNPYKHPGNMLAIANSDPVEAPLEFSLIEVAALNDFFTPGSLTIYSNESASRENIFSSIGSTRYLHAACHSYFDWEDPMNSGIRLYGDTLTLRELMNKEVQLSGVRLVNLSCCESGISEFVELPDEAISLPAGFMLAGVPGIVSSLWSVSDISTTLLMKKFYELHIIASLDPVSSLRQSQFWLKNATNQQLQLSELSERLYATGKDRVFAQLYLYASANPDATPFSHPYYWAGFYYLGA